MQNAEKNFFPEFCANCLLTNVVKYGIIKGEACARDKTGCVSKDRPFESVSRETFGLCSFHKDFFYFWAFYLLTSSRKCDIIKGEGRAL